MAEKPTRPEQTEVVGPPRLLAGKYRIGRLIGEGGMGSVYLAEHTGLDANVAVKLLNDTCIADPDSLARFRREAKAMGAVRHDNVVSVMDTGTDEEGIPFIVMEYLEGETLSATLRRNRTMSPASAVRVASQILAGLSAAHQKGIVHRDLKPGNVFMARQPDSSVRPKILDFGVSKLVDAAALSVTADGVAVGTPTYMAPEQVRGNLDLDQRVDIYAVGVMIYRMLTGKLPFVSRSAEDLSSKILTGTPRPPSEIKPDVPATLERVVLKAMSVRADDRYPDAETFRAALAAASSAQMGIGNLDVSSFLDPGDATDSGDTNDTGDGADEVTLEAQTIAASPQAKRNTEPPPLAVAASTPVPLPAAAEPAAPLPRDPDPEPGARPSRRGLLVALAALIAIAVFALIALRSISTAPSGPPLHLGVTANLPAIEVTTRYSTFLDYLSKTLNRPVELRVASDKDELGAWLAAGEVDFAALSAFPYVEARAKIDGLQPLASGLTRAGRSGYFGAILVRTDSDIRGLDDIAGKPFCFVRQGSTSGWLLPRRVLRAAGLDPDTAFPTVHYGQNHLGSLKLLARGTCEAAAVYAQLWHDASKHQLDPASFRSIADYSTPHDAYVGAPTLSKKEAGRIGAALLDLTPRSERALEALEDLDLSGFQPLDEGAYRDIREAIAAEPSFKK